MNSFQGKILCVCGGVGGAKLAYGFSQLLSSEQLSIVVNTGDDFEHLGFYISPDIDTVLYNLAEMNNTELGWGIQNETWNFMEQLKQSDPENNWFLLGDKDLLTHQNRKKLLANGKPLSEITRLLCEQYGVKHSVIPMSDDPVRTMVQTKTGELPFQHYFVKQQCAPEVTGFYFNGIETAKPSAAFLKALAEPELAAIIICPSNPFVSIDPVLSLPGINKKIQGLNIPVIAVSPIINGQAIKGPTAKMMEELEIPRTSLAIAQHYRGLISALVIDDSDAHERSAIESLGIRCEQTQTLMKTKADKMSLASYLLQHIETTSAGH